MRRSILLGLLLLLAAESAYAQSGGGRLGRPGSGGGGGMAAPAVSAPRNIPSSGRATQAPATGGAAQDQQARMRGWMWRAEWRWGGYSSPMFFGSPFGGYTYSLPYANPVPEFPAEQAVDWLAPATEELPAPAPVDPIPPGRLSSPEQKARAGRYLNYGDTLFGKQKYLAALGRYKSASEAASDTAEAYLRQGFAYVAMGQYAQASKAFRRGLALRSNWQGTAFRLETLYDGAEAVKTQHIEKLALAVEENPFDSGLLMTLGVELFFDGQFDRAELCFQNATRLGGSDEALVADFLPGAKPAAAPAPGKSRKVTF